MTEMSDHVGVERGGMRWACWAMGLRAHHVRRQVLAFWFLV